MSTYRINMADERLIGQIVDPETLVQRVPRMEEFFKGVEDMRAALAQEADGKGRYTKTSGWWKGSRTMQYVGTTPISVRAAIREIDPGFWEDPVKVVRFYDLHPEYKVKSVVS